MSRVAKNPVTIPSGVEINIDQKSISVSGAKGKSEFLFPSTVSAVHADEMVSISYDEASPESTALAGTTRSLINNMVIGVSEGFQKTLLLVGVGYRAKANGKKLELTLGFSHPVHYDLPEVKNGLGMFVLSTNKGLMSDKDARSQNIGGEVICEVF